jgi:hypothetical protein
MSWVIDPRSGGVKIPKNRYATIQQKGADHAAKGCADQYLRIKVRFRGACRHIGAYCNPRLPPGPPAERETFSYFPTRPSMRPLTWPSTRPLIGPATGAIADTAARTADESVRRSRR